MEVHMSCNMLELPGSPCSTKNIFMLFPNTLIVKVLYLLCIIINRSQWETYSLCISLSHFWKGKLLMTMLIMSWWQPLLEVLCYDWSFSLCTLSQWLSRVWDLVSQIAHEVEKLQLDCRTSDCEWGIMWWNLSPFENVPVLWNLYDSETVSPKEPLRMARTQVWPLHVHFSTVVRLIRREREICIAWSKAWI